MVSDHLYAIKSPDFWSFDDDLFDGYGSLFVSLCGCYCCTLKDNRPLLRSRIRDKRRNETDQSYAVHYL